MQHRTPILISLPLTGLMMAVALAACTAAPPPHTDPEGGSGGTAGGNPGTGGGSGPSTGGCTPGQLADHGTLNGRYGIVDTAAGGLEYFLQVNEWNASATQSVTFGGSDFFFQMTTQQASVPTTGGPTGFPSMFIGANSNHITDGSNLPKLVSDLTTVPTTWNWNDAGTLADTANNSYNATYDVWFSTSAAGEPAASAPSGGFLMVWLHKPTDAQPIGSIKYNGVTIAGVDGTWDVWIGLNGNKPCISYVRTQTTLSLSYDLNAFIKDAVANRPSTIQSAWYLSNIFSGFEIWRGGQGIETTSFCAVVN
jgi:hypothetical protein